MIRFLSKGIQWHLPRCFVCFFAANMCNNAYAYDMFAGGHCQRRKKYEIMYDVP